MFEVPPSSFLTPELQRDHLYTKMKNQPASQVFWKTFSAWGYRQYLTEEKASKLVEGAQVGEANIRMGPRSDLAGRKFPVDPRFVSCHLPAASCRLPAADGPRTHTCALHSPITYPLCCRPMCKVAMRVTANSASADMAEKVWSTTKQVTSSTRGHLAKVLRWFGGAASTFGC